MAERTAMESDVARLTHFVFGNGQPGIEERLKDHAAKNLARVAGDLRHEMEERENRQENRHIENSLKLKYLEDGQVKTKQWQDRAEGAMRFGKIVGSVIAFLCMAILGLLGYLAATRTEHSSILSNQPTVAQGPYHAGNE